MVNNYLALTTWSAASSTPRASSLQVDVLLAREAAAKREGQSYAEDAFARYLTGIVYKRGEASDAMIAYRKAYEPTEATQVLPCHTERSSTT